MKAEVEGMRCRYNAVALTLGEKPNVTIKNWENLQKAPLTYHDRVNLLIFEALRLQHLAFVTGLHEANNPIPLSLSGVGERMQSVDMPSNTLKRDQWGVSREKAMLGLSEGEEEAFNILKKKAEKLKLNTFTDSFGNLYLIKRGSNPNSNRIRMMGSHVDGVVGCGDYDGRMGSAIAFQALETIQTLKIETKDTVIVPVWRMEESSRIGKAFSGSQYAAQGLTAEYLQTTDKQFTRTEAITMARNAGREIPDHISQVDLNKPLTLAEMLQLLGRDPQKVNQTTGFSELFNYLNKRLKINTEAITDIELIESHIEQADELILTDAPMALVESIANAARVNFVISKPSEQEKPPWEGASGFVEVVISGVADHSGTTPLGYRADALLIGAQFIQALRKNDQATNMHICRFSEGEGGSANIVPATSKIIIEYPQGQKNIVFAALNQISSAIAEPINTSLQTEESKINRALKNLGEAKTREKGAHISLSETISTADLVPVQKQEVYDGIAQAIISVNHGAKEFEAHTRATVTRLTPKLDGSIDLFVDVRRIGFVENSSAPQDAIFGAVERALQKVEFKPAVLATPTAMSQELMKKHTKWMKGLGMPVVQMPSAAGHDVSNIASKPVVIQTKQGEREIKIYPALWFVRNMNGSHNPQERVRSQDLQYLLLQSLMWLTDNWKYR